MNIFRLTHYIKLPQKAIFNTTKHLKIENIKKKVLFVNGLFRFK